MKAVNHQTRICVITAASSDWLPMSKVIAKLKVAFNAPSYAPGKDVWYCHMPFDMTDLMVVDIIKASGFPQPVHMRFEFSVEVQPERHL